MLKNGKYRLGVVVVDVKWAVVRVLERLLQIG